MTTRDVFGLEKYSREVWQRHEARRLHPSFTEAWPTVRDFKQNWPLLAPHLIQARTQVSNEAAGHHDLPPVPYELLDPPEVEHADWRQLYADELASHPRFGWPMAQENPVGALLGRFTRSEEKVQPGQAGYLSPLESISVRLWCGGYSYRAIADATGADPRNALNRVNRGLEKLRALAGLQELAS